MLQSCGEMDRRAHRGAGDLYAFSTALLVAACEERVAGADGCCLAVRPAVKAQVAVSARAFHQAKAWDGGAKIVLQSAPKFSASSQSQPWIRPEGRSINVRDTHTGGNAAHWASDGSPADPRKMWSSPVASFLLPVKPPLQCWLDRQL